ncbi:MAG: Nif3-like dinuclear metal center hexameric protein [Myxococcales bacterium]|nr:Nif3-like dinuclear metal center hexameric protein [Myxococcales bacterium]
MPAARTLGELLGELGRRAPWGKAWGADPVGLQLGDPSCVAERVAVCHEVTEAVVDQLEAAPPSLLVSYHPLLFRPTLRILAGPTPAGRAYRLLRAGVALAVVHTSFDVAPGGAADALAAALGLAEVRGFAPLEGPDSIKLVSFLPADHAERVLQAVSEAGAGRIGNYTHCSFRSDGVGSFFAAAGTDPAVGKRAALNQEREQRIEFVAPREREAEVVNALLAAHPYEEPAYDVYARGGSGGLVGRIGRLENASTLARFAERVSGALDQPRLRVAGDASREIACVAVVPGSGTDYLAQAAALGADVVVTGDVSHHAARASLDRGLAVIDAGHAPTEAPGLRTLYAWLADLAPGAESLLHLDPDPWAGP